MRSAIDGARVWLTYGIVEYSFAAIAPLLLAPDTVLASWHWTVSGFLFVAYAAAGAVAGALCGMARLSTPKREAALAAGVAAAFVANLAASSWPLSTIPALMLGLALTAALLVHISSERWPHALAPLRNPWAISLLLLAPPWVSRDLALDQSLNVRRAGSLAAAAAVYCAAWWMSHRRVDEVPSRSPWITLAAAAGLAAVLAGTLGQRRPILVAPPHAAGAAQRPNVVMIVLDTVRASHLSVYGYARDTTPRLRQFAQQSVLFRHAIASSDITLSSHASMFTGLNPSEHGAHSVGVIAPYGRPLRSDVPTLAERLAAAGYSTYAAVANYAYLSTHFGLLRGFQNISCPVPVRLYDAARDYYLRDGLRRLWGRFAPAWEFVMEVRRAPEINRDAFRFIEAQRDRRTPFLLFVNYMDAHFPYVPPAPYRGRFPGIDQRLTFESFMRLHDQVMSLERSLPPEAHHHLVSQYDGALAYLDSQLGELFAHLKENNLYEDSVILVTSDHGEALGERDFLQHGGVSVYEDQLHVPFILKYPRQVRRGVVEENVSHVDILPTLLEMAGLPAPENLAGVSLASAPPPAERIILSESFPSGYLTRFHPRFRRVERAIYRGSTKFIQSTAGKRELYHLSQDPDEGSDQSAVDRPSAAALEAALAAWTESVRARARPDPASSNLEKGVLDRLKSLGYAQ